MDQKEEVPDRLQTTQLSENSYCKLNDNYTVIKALN